MECSIEFSVTKLTTVTARFWPLRQARAMRCSSLAGFQGRSRLMTALATWRLRPTAPASDERNSRQAGSSRKRAISARRLSWGTSPVCQAHSTPISAASLPHEIEHFHPFGEDDDLARRLLEELRRIRLQLFELRADPALGIEDGRRVADHPHAGEILLQAIELLFRQRTALRYGGELARKIFIVAVALRLLFGHGDEERLLRCGREARPRRRAFSGAASPRTRRRCISSRFL